jgi:hypothetical protein
MRLIKVARKLRLFAGHESGITLIETLVALAIVSTVAVSFLGGLSMYSRLLSIPPHQCLVEVIIVSIRLQLRLSLYKFLTTVSRR